MIRDEPSELYTTGLDITMANDQTIIEAPARPSRIEYDNQREEVW